MKTEDLIAALAADAPRTGPRLDTVWAVALACAGVLATAVFFGTIGPRADFWSAAQTVRFDFKFVLTGVLAVTSFLMLRALAVPGANRPHWSVLALAPALGIGAVLLELFVLPAGAWQMAQTGKNALVCLTYIPLIGLAPVGALILALRRGAPTRPALAGGIAGLLAGGIAATLYAAHCTDDSPLFVMTWYPIAIAMLVALGAILGRIFARW
ncbi:NrsF family protein [Pelagibacterium xiamenense]|uniref:NrsF family protein n=1 Tax=Pelagibacterium xiamenense TaxID=2901140 RepID=UPI001E5F6CD2|nr:NrsF family protein [Pelagibacterium xiamenense]MCD7059031.1 NrsF family protein [Pelagibacterium xiamenense]